MKFMLLAFTNVSTWDGGDVSAADVQAICEFYEKLQRDLTASGEWVGSEGLADPSHGRAVRRAGSSVVVTDGPLVEAKETLVSFSIVDVADLDRALEIATRVVEVTGDSVEVRPVMELDYGAVP